MILVDTSIWIDHLRAKNETLTHLLDVRDILIHPFIIGELALGHLSGRDVLLKMWRRLPAATLATDAEVLGLVNQQKLFGLGIGYVDAHLLAALKLAPGTRLWTRDKRLSEIAYRLHIPRFFHAH